MYRALCLCGWYHCSLHISYHITWNMAASPKLATARTINRHQIHGGDIDPTPHSFCLVTKLGFHLNWNMDWQNNIYWPAGHFVLIHELPVHDIKVGVWYAVSVTRFIGSFLFPGDHKFTHTLQTFWLHFLNTQDNYHRWLSFWWQNNKYILLPPCSPVLNLCDLYLWNASKDKLYCSNLPTEGDLTRCIWGCRVFSFTCRTLIYNEQCVMLVCELKETIFNTLNVHENTWDYNFLAPLNMTSKILVLSTIKWNKKSGSWFTADWNSSNWYAVCHHIQHSMKSPMICSR